MVRLRLCPQLTEREVRELQARAAADMRSVGSTVALLLIADLKRRGSGRGQRASGVSPGDKRRAYEVAVPLTAEQKRKVEGTGEGRGAVRVEPRGYADRGGSSPRLSESLPSVTPGFLSEVNDGATFLVWSRVRLLEGPSSNHLAAKKAVGLTPFRIRSTVGPPGCRGRRWPIQRFGGSGFIQMRIFGRKGWNRVERTGPMSKR